MNFTLMYMYHIFQFPEDNPTKLFMGRLPRGTTVEDLRECFSEYGVLKDVYIPTNFRGFGFVTFASQAAANEVLNSTHVIKVSVHLSYFHAFCNFV